MTARDDLAAALLRVYALALAAIGEGRAAGVMLAQAVNLEHRPPSAAQTDALILAGYVTPDGRVTDAGRAVLAQVLDGAQHEN